MTRPFAELRGHYPRLHQRQHGLPDSPLQLTVPGQWVEGSTLPRVEIHVADQGRPMEH